MEAVTRDDVIHSSHSVNELLGLQCPQFCAKFAIFKISKNMLFSDWNILNHFDALLFHNMILICGDLIEMFPYPYGMVWYGMVWYGMVWYNMI